MTRLTNWWMRSFVSCRRRVAVRKFRPVPFFRPLRFESLEDRRPLAVFTVTNTADSGVGSLRQAILDANAAGTVDQIVFSNVTGTIALTSAELLITDSVTITGPGANLLTIKQTAVDRRVLNISGGLASADKSISISGLTITGGNLTGVGNNGAGIRSRENLTITGSVISGNTTSGANGGGIYQYDGTLTIHSTTISGNTAVRAGGIYTGFATANVTSSTISGNRATAGVQFGGGGIINSSGSLTVDNSTISSNIADDQGGGINNFFGTLIVRHSTITNNRNDANNSGFGQGGGIFTNSGATLHHTIVAGNFRGAGATRDDVFGSATAAFSLIGDNTGAVITNSGGNQIGTGISPIDPKLGGLFDNGGPTFSHALLPGSPAIDVGQTGIVSAPISDQRGAPFVRIADGDGVGGARIDIGAYERQTVAGLNLIVDSLHDEVDGNYSTGNLSLREAIGLANGSVGSNVITFSASLTGNGPTTIVLRHGELIVRDDLTVTGPGADLLTIDASGNDPTPNMNNGDGSRVFQIADGTATSINVELSGLSLTGGDVTGSGGAIFNVENLTLLDSVVFGNAANTGGNGGGGIGTAGGSLTITRSVIRNNEAANGGGIAASADFFSMFESSVSDNHATFRGGGIWITESPFVHSAVRNSTISGNTASNGGGVYHSSRNMYFIDSAISGNTATLRGGGIYHRFDERTISRVFNSTVSGNHANEGGGIFHRGPMDPYGSFTHGIHSSTITGNVAQSRGGGFFNYAGGGSLVLMSTITENSAGIEGGGILANARRVGEFGPRLTKTSVRNSIVSGNSNGDVRLFEPGHFDVIESQGFNLIGTGHVAAFTASGDQVGVLDPKLGPLRENGGPTKTHLPQPGSPAIDRGDPSLNHGPGEQRGEPFQRAADGDGIGGARIDIGAVERQGGLALSLVVDTLADENDGIYTVGDLSLREAIGLANGSIGLNTITFAPSLFAAGPATIVLTLGELQILDALQINGPGSNWLTIDASGNDPTPSSSPFDAIMGDDGDGSSVFVVDNYLSAIMDVSIVGLTIKGGDSVRGGGILSNENLTLTDCRIVGNRSWDGGGIFHTAGELKVSQSEISGNAAFDGGGIYGFLGSVEIDNTTVSNNRGLDGGGIAQVGASLIVRNSTISGNLAERGGGVYANNSLFINESTVSRNQATNIGGGILSYRAFALHSSTVSGNQAGVGGGGIYFKNNGPPLDLATILNSTISSNSAVDGGGIVSTGRLRIEDSTFHDNTATFGGGVSHNGSLLEVKGSTFSDNFASQGGGLLIETDSNQATITNSTISGNHALQSGGGVLVGKGIANFAHSTVTNNQAPLNGGGGISARSGLASVKLISNIVAKNVMGGDVQFFDGAINPFVSQGYNLLDTGNAVANFNQPGDQTDVADPLLGPLTYNGGPTRTHALFGSSPAVNASDPEFSPGGDVPENDQRGEPYSRAFGGGGVFPRVDIGAFEAQPHLLPGDYNFDNNVDAADYVVWRKMLSTSVPMYSGADGDGDSTVDPDDYDVWQGNFGEILPGLGSGSAVPQPRAARIQAVEPGEAVPTESNSALAETNEAAVRTPSFATLATLIRTPDSSFKAARRPINQHRVTTCRADDLLLLAIDRIERNPLQAFDMHDDDENDELHSDDSINSRFEELLAVALEEWQ